MTSRQKGFMRTNAAKGFSLMEVLIAVSILAVAILGAVTMIVIGIGRNGSNRMDTTATNVAQTVMEDIAAVPAKNNANLPIADCQNNPLVITTFVGGSPLNPNTGDIDFSQAPVPNYQFTYFMCGANGAPVPYDVRWRVDGVGAPIPGTPPGTILYWAKAVTVAVRQPLDRSRSAVLFIPPVTLRTVVSQ